MEEQELHTMRALIVDDDETFCRLLEKVLNRQGIEVEWTTDSLAGYEKALHNVHDLFLLDVRMPGLLGTEFARRLKKENPNAQIILISAFADEPLREAAKSLSVALLSKPFPPNSLLKVIAEILGQQR
jgi:two-component system response regulator HydG